MRTKLLLITVIGCFLLKANAQIHPASMWMNTFQFNATSHVHENWVASGYNIYDINMVKDANGYITNIQTSTTGLMVGSVDQYISSGSRTNNVFTASTQKKLHGTTTFLSWRKETWLGDGTKDTVIMWQDSLNGAWTNVVKHVLHYSSGTIMDLMTDYNWSVATSAWVPATKTAITYSGSNYSIMNQYIWVAATSNWTQNGNIKYYFSTKLDSIWMVDSSGVTQQRVFATADGTGKTKSITALNWDAGTSTWKAGVSMTFDNNLATGLREVSSSNNETLIVCPNPANNFINLKTDNYLNGKARIIDLCGREVLSQNITEQDATLETTNLNNGIYILQIEKEGQFFSQRKIVINH